MGGLSRAVSGLRSAARRRELRASPDAELVRAFARNCDEAAFEQLVRRHGPLVLGVCQRVHPPSADDAFQATFLLLALKAGTLRDPAGVAGWLHGVAVRTSREAKAVAARRRLKERLAAKPEPAPAPPDAEALALLDEAVAALPARYRAAVMLCDLAEKTRAEAAAELGVPEGTVASRLARGRKLLAAKLTGKGLAVPVLIGAAAPSPALVTTTVQTGVLLAAGGTVPPALHPLVSGVTRAMSGSVLKPVVAAGLLAAGLGGAWGLAAGDGPKPADPPVPPAAKPAAETPAEQWKKLKAEFDAELKANTRPQLDPATGKPRIPRGFEVTQPDAAKYADRLLALGRCADRDTAAAALTLAAIEYPNTKLGDPAFDLLLERFADDGRQLRGYARQQISRGFGHDFARAERLLGVSADPYVRAYSTLKLAIHHYNGGTPEAAARATTLFKRVTTDFPTVDGGHAARWARGILAEAERLRPGLPARPLAGADLDGRPMALADLKGQVVCLYVGSVGNTNTFDNLDWLKAAYAKYAGRGVAVVGLLATFDVAEAKAEVVKHQVPWRTWPDLRDRRTGESPVETDWGIRTSPAVILIDRAGVIVDPVVRSPQELEAALDKLLATPAKP
jgi:RNA polymerase sigma factor (sigma-70 family)